MPTDKLDMDKVKSFLTKHLKDITESAKVKFRAINKAVKKQFGKGLFVPQLSAVVRSIRPDLAKPAKTVVKRRGKKPGPKPGTKYAKRAVARESSGAGYMITVGRNSRTVRSHARLQAVVDQLLAGGTSVGKLKVFRLVRVTVATRVEIGE
ncbi:MAG: hypothetical protein K8T20_11640 [Planctomycetes bacterium]|nr:hypothetical protein [Planctomycetota bacterium]